MCVCVCMHVLLGSLECDDNLEILLTSSTSGFDTEIFARDGNICIR